MKSVIFVAVVYNNYQDTADFVGSLSALSKNDVFVRCVIVDNSDDRAVSDALDNLSDLCDTIQILRPASNLGYFGAFNFFFDQLSHKNSDFVILCNNDLVISKNFVEMLLLQQYSDDVFVVCPDVVTLDGRHQNPHVVRPRTFMQRLKLDLYFSFYFAACLLTWLRSMFMLNRRQRVTPVTLQPQYLHMGIGACYVLLPSFLSRFDRLEYPHFLYGEEAYLSRQVLMAGGKLFFDPNLVVLHKDSATLSTLPKQTTYKYARDGYWYYRKFY